jgi:hypothetical protein
MKKITVLITIIVMVAVVVSACGGGGSSTNAKDSVQIQSGWTCSGITEYMTFQGTVKNISSNYDLKLVVLRVTVYMGDGTTVVNTSTGLVDSETVNKGQTSIFDIMLYNPNNTGTNCMVTVEDASYVK